MANQGKNLDIRLVAGVPIGCAFTRNLVERIVLTPLPTGKGFEIELIGESAAMIRLGMERPPAVQQGHHAKGPGLFERSIKVVAGIGFEPMTFRL